METNLYNSLKKQYIHVFAQEQVTEFMTRPLAFSSPDAIKRQAAMEAQEEIDLLKKRLTKGIELVMELKSSLYQIDQELLEENLEKIMKFLESFTNAEDLQTLASTWALPDRTLVLSDDFYNLLKCIGSELLINKRDNEASDLFLLINLLFPCKPEIWLQLGEIEQVQGNFQKAQMMYAQAILIDFNICSSHLRMTECLIELGDRESALYSLQIAESLSKEIIDKQKCKDLLNKINLGVL